jgi:hypothetical protein
MKYSLVEDVIYLAVPAQASLAPVASAYARQVGV